MRAAGVGALVALLVVALPAVAQDVPASRPENPSTPLFSLGGGPAIPYGTTADAHVTGFHAGAAGVFPVVSRLGIEVSASYVRLGPDRDAALVALGIDPVTFGPAGGFLEGGYRWGGAVTAGPRILLVSPARRVVPHVSAGIGYALAGVADTRVLYLRESETVDGLREHGPAFSVGAGVEVGVGHGVSIFGRARHLEVFTDRRFAATMPFTLGISLRLEER